MTESTNMDTYEASASDCITTQPPLLNSRKPQHRKLHSRNSAYYKQRQASYQTRRKKRIRESEYPELSSSDEYHPPPPLTQSGLPNPNFLPHMPRPSDIVPAIEDGSASDAGFDSNARQIHKRRVKATRILLASIGPKGNIMPVPHWKRNRSGLSKYTTFMNPPQQDKNLPDLRVPPQLLSRYYRGSLLAIHRVGRPQKRRKKENETSAAPEASAFECEYLGSSSHSDFQVVESHTLVKSEPEQIAEHDNTQTTPVHASGKNADMQPVFSKDEFFEELERVAAGSSCEISDSEMERLCRSGVRTGASSGQSHSEEEPEDNPGNGTSAEREAKVPASTKGHAESSADSSHDKMQENLTPEKKSEIDLLRDMLKLNPDLLLEEQKPLDKEMIIQKQADERNGESDESESNLTEFERDKRTAMLFSHNTTKRPRSTAKDMAAKYLIPSKRHKYVGPPDDGDVPASIAPASNGASDSRMNLKFTMKLMNKMGFTGRLGKKEDGRKDPLLPARRSFRSGIGSRSAQTPAWRGDQSLLPTKFKGKSVGSATPDGSSDTPSAAGGDEAQRNGIFPSNPNGSFAEDGDVFTKRRKRNAQVSDRGAPPDQDSTRSGTRNRTAKPAEKTQTRQLDDDDIYETDDEDSGVDNGRRAILIDIDALIKDSAKRRLDAIVKVLNDASLRLDVRKLLAKEPRDLCEADLLRKVLGHANVKPRDMEGFSDKLDEAFESLRPPELDIELLDMLRQYSKDVHFGIFHRGSRRRLQYDLAATGLTNSFLQEVCATVKHEEKWPYIETWQDLTCRVGVGPRQCLYVLSDVCIVKRAGEGRPSTGVTAGASLGARTAIWKKDADGVKLFVRSAKQKEQVLKINNSSAYSDRKKVFDELLKDRMPVLKRRRVLAQYEDDMLWYSAVVQYEGVKDGKCWIQFNKFENTEWVCNEDLVPLCRRDFRKMKMMDFPGLIDSDASVL